MLQSMISRHVRCILEAEMSRREQVRRYCRENDEGEAERSAKVSVCEFPIEVYHIVNLLCSTLKYFFLAI